MSAPLGLRTLFGCLVCLLGLASPSFAQTASDVLAGAKVVAYGSGTSFAVLDRTEKLKRIKLTGVDAPERKQRFASQAKQLAAEWLGVKSIDIAIDATDKDGRIHGRAAVDGRDVGLMLIEAGLAWCDPHDESYLAQAVRETYRQACERAKNQRRGLWQDANPSPPWEYRKIPEFDPLPGKQSSSARRCEQVGHETVQCDDGSTYRGVGSQVIGSDGVVYSKRGNTVTGSDGNRFQQQGTSVYGTDGSVCRGRGRGIDCF